MLARAPQSDIFDEVKQAAATGSAWCFWRAPDTAPRVETGAVQSFFSTPFDRTSYKRPVERGYPELVSDALLAIEQGRVEKVVLARRQRLSPADPVATLQQLERTFPTCFVFGVSDGEDTFIGATPEVLASIRGRALKTCALAGTSAPGDDGLLRSEKDLREHVLVVRAIREALQPLCETVTVAAHPTILRLPNVQHLHTPITATLRAGVAPAEVVRALHPTPAVCGSPRVEARRLIAELEPFDRELYAGVVGWLDGDAADFAVAIRSAKFSADATYLYAGAGIVAGSNPELEDRETHAKLRAVLDSLRYR